jgi:3'(2'), 5'-bisphosphate nucleotidase
MIDPHSVLADELQEALDLAERAGREVMQVFAGEFDVQHKGGDGPVTIADTRADRLIRERLSARFPGDALLTEEHPDDPARLDARRLWLIDPLDGTQQFVRRIPEFAVMIGLAIDGEARLGVVHLPAEGRTFYGVVGVGAHELLQTTDRSQRPLRFAAGAVRAPWRAAISRLNAESKTRQVVAALGASELMSGSVGRKAGLVVSGEADFYLSLGGRTKHWDACAPDAIVRAAGGFFGTPEGLPLRYNTPRIVNERGLLVCSPQLVAPVSRAVQAVRRE